MALDKKIQAQDSETTTYPTTNWSNVDACFANGSGSATCSNATLNKLHLLLAGCDSKISAGGDAFPYWDGQWNIKINCTPSKSGLLGKVALYWGNTTDVTDINWSQEFSLPNAGNSGLLGGANGIDFNFVFPGNQSKENGAPNLKLRFQFRDRDGTFVDGVDSVVITHANRPMVWFEEIPLPTAISMTNFTAVQGDVPDKIVLNWNDPGDGTATSYIVLRNTVNDLNSATNLTPTKPSRPDTSNYNDLTATGGLTYYYWVKSHNMYKAEDNVAPYENYGADSAATGPIWSTALLASVSLTPSPVILKAATQTPAVLIPPLIIIPAHMEMRLKTKAPFQLADTDVDGFFQALAQVHAYTNFGYRKRDTTIAIDQSNNIVTWCYPTTSSDSFSVQLPRVILAINVMNGTVGLGCPIPTNLDPLANSSYTPIKTKNIFALLTIPRLWWRARQKSILAICPKSGTDDDTITNTENDEKTIYHLDMQSWTGINSDYGDARIITKFFRPPTKSPNIKTRIVSCRPIFSHGNASGLTMRGMLWSTSSYLKDDNLYARSPDFTSNLIVDGGVILFNDSHFSLEHCVGLSFDTNDGLASYPIAHVYSGGSITGIEIEYVEQEEGWV